VVAFKVPVTVMVFPPVCVTMESPTAFPAVKTANVPKVPERLEPAANGAPFHVKVPALLYSFMVVSPGTFDTILTPPLFTTIGPELMVPVHPEEAPTAHPTKSDVADVLVVFRVSKTPGAGICAINAVEEAAIPTPSIK
jgi:hypothetical protein